MPSPSVSEHAADRRVMMLIVMDPHPKRLDQVQPTDGGIPEIGVAKQALILGPEELRDPLVLLGKRALKSPQ